MEQKFTFNGLNEEQKEDCEFIEQQMKKLPEGIHQSLSFLVKGTTKHHTLFRPRMTERAIHMVNHKCSLLSLPVAELGSQNVEQLVMKCAG